MPKKKSTHHRVGRLLQSSLNGQVHLASRHVRTKNELDDEASSQLCNNNRDEFKCGFSRKPLDRKRVHSEIMSKNTHISYLI